jgi:cell division protein FtsW
MLLGYAGFRTAQRAKDRYGRLLAAALTAMILVQASINLFAVLGLAPLTGVTLPFVSYGNSSLIVTLAAVGLLLNIASGGRAPAVGAGGRLRLVDGGASTAPRRRTTSAGGARAAGGDRGRRYGGTRGAGAGRRRRAR